MMCRFLAMQLLIAAAVAMLAARALWPPERETSGKSAAEHAGSGPTVPRGPKATGSRGNSAAALSSEEAVEAADRIARGGDA